MDTALDFRDHDKPLSGENEETLIAEMRPTLRASAGMILIGILLIPFFLIGVLILLAVAYRTASRKYRLTSKRLFVELGLLARHIEEIELYRLKDLTVRQGPLQRLFGVGTVIVRSTDHSNPCVALKGIVDPVESKERIRHAASSARKCEGVRTAELIRN
ncbi:MAG: PH domain-containing protein [Kiritimatiellae bacterium]|nr:PH domain-containing protein [Kiritimatiellia bacterium]